MQALESTDHTVEEAGEAFHSVSESVEGISDAFDLISLNTKQQVRAIREVMEAVERIDAEFHQALELTGSTHNQLTAGLSGEIDSSRPEHSPLEARQ